MSVKNGFTLIEITVVILLMGILYSMVLSAYNRRESVSTQSIRDLPPYMDRKGYRDGILYIYGDLCQNGVFIDRNKREHKTSIFNYNKECIPLKRDDFFRFSEIRFTDIRVEKKNERVCFALPYRDGRFFDNYILSCPDNNYLFEPFWQRVQSFDSAEKAKEVGLKEEMYPQNEDDYHHE